jgi:hypothetical protein
LKWLNAASGHDSESLCELSTELDQFSMKNAETPVIKILLFGAISSLGSALMAEMLHRKHEVIAEITN